MRTGTWRVALVRRRGLYLAARQSCSRASAWAASGTVGADTRWREPRRATGRSRRRAGGQAPQQPAQAARRPGQPPPRHRSAAHRHRPHPRDGCRGRHGRAASARGRPPERTGAARGTDRPRPMRRAGYEIKELPAGRYSLNVSKGGYISLQIRPAHRARDRPTPRDARRRITRRGELRAAPGQRRSRAASSTSSANRSRKRWCRPCATATMRGRRRLLPAGRGAPDRRPRRSTACTACRPASTT